MAKNVNYDDLVAFKTEADKVYATKGELGSKQDTLTTEQLANLNKTSPTITTGTTDLEAGTSTLATGDIYLVYEE